MPGFDATGPRGLGPGTGWGRGPCGAGMRRGAARSWGQRFRGGGWRQPQMMRPWGDRPAWGHSPWWFGFYGPEGATAGASPQDEAAALKKEEACLKSELEAVRKRLSELDTPQT